MGLGRFGGGLGVTRWLARHGARVLLTDRADAASLSEPLHALDPFIGDGRVQLRLGGHDAADFRDADLVVASPAVPAPWDNEFLAAADDAGVSVTTEIGLAIQRLPDRARTIGVTGTAGKSTTSTMIARAIEAAGQQCLLGGNIGGSILEAIDDAPADTLAGAFVVLELSSFMLHWLGRDAWSPGTAVVTNIRPNHLDWHRTFEHYQASKRHIARHQHAGDALVAPADLWPDLNTPTRIDPRTEHPPPLRVPGAHNRDNAACALSAARTALGRFGIAMPAAASDAIAGFPGLPHRLEHVVDAAAAGGTVAFYNDSKSTTPEAAALAVDAVAERTPPDRIALIAGGADKGVDLAAIARLATRGVALCTIGATGPRIVDEARAAGGRAQHHGTLERAFEAATAHADVAGGAVLLSPGCASWDQFDHFEQRGDAFRTLAHRFAAARAAGAGGLRHA